MTDIPQLAGRPLPSFDQWLEKHTDGERGAGFDELRDLAMRTHAHQPDHLTADEASFMRLWMGIQIAVVELCNIERAKGRKPEQIIAVMPRVLGTAAMYAVASVLEAGAPLRPIATSLTEEFRHGAKMSADTISKDQEAGS